MSAMPRMMMVRTPESAAAMLDQTRLRLLGTLRSAEGETAAGLARRVGMKRQLVNYHLRELEKAGLVEEVATRQRGSARERIVRATASAYAIDPGVMGELGPEPGAVGDRFSSAHLVAVAATTIRDVATLRARADAAGQTLATLSMLAHVRFASAADRGAFFEDLANEVAKLIAEYHDEHAAAGRWTTLTIGSYPTITKDESGRDLPEPPRAGIEESAGDEGAPARA